MTAIVPSPAAGRDVASGRSLEQQHGAGRTHVARWTGSIFLAALLFASGPRAGAVDEAALIEEDWRRQDGIGTEREPSGFAAAVERTLDRGAALLRSLDAAGSAPAGAAAELRSLREELRRLEAAGPAGEDLWRRAHRARRRWLFSHPLAPTGPLLFVKQVPGIFSHQLTQYYGSCARPGGGIFVLDAPGRSLAARQLAPGALPAGSYQHAEVSPDGRKVLFAFCGADTTPPDRETHLDRFYHLHEMGHDGSGLRQLTDGPWDDFSPKYLPGGRIVFVSTRRGGFHRCGRGPCPVYTLALCEADGSQPRSISYHETHEWDPSVLGDGRLIYTRWDYVDRNAVFYQQLWTVRPDGSDVRILYGNNTFNPVGVWEARAVPGSNRVMATAAAHHAMTAGSIILIDVARGADGAAPIRRLTPDALFPESEAPVAQRGPGAWHAPVGAPSPPSPPETPVEARRWPGHCYRTPYPLAEDLFLAAYSFDPLIGEPDANAPAMFGLYLIDGAGNKELLHRDPEISSLWPVPLGPQQRPLPPELTSQLDGAGSHQGTFIVLDVHESWPALPRGSVRRLRIVQVLPKTTPHANDPMLGMASASPGKQVLGTVPVETDGSAHFTAPAGVPLAFQALDGDGAALQTMRSVAYLQPGETAACVGCHEHRSSAPPATRQPLALARAPSTIEPAPDGSLPLSYPILVQPVLDRHCVPCHGAVDPAGGLTLTGEPQGRFTASYNALAPRVPYADWAGRPGDFREINCEPLTRPGFFGARASSLYKLLRAGHEGAHLAARDWERLITWMDANALFYGTFDPDGQARQLRGERIASPGSARDRPGS